MSELANAVVRITADIEDLEAGLKLVKEEMEKTGKDLEDLGNTMMLKVTLPLTILGGLAVKAFGESQDAVARLSATLQAAGGVTGTTTQEVLALADAMQELTRFGGSAVAGAAALMATFHQVRNEMGAGNDIFDRAIKSSADLAATMGNDLAGAATQLGRALEDPEIGLTLLRRAGIQFSAAEREQIRIMMEHGQVLEAQRIILDKVEAKTRGVAEAMAKTPLGHFAQAWNEVKGALKRVGSVIAEVLVPFADILKEIAKWFKELPSWAIVLTVAIATMAAAIGPLLVAWVLLLKVFAGFQAAAALGVLGPIGLIILAIGALVLAGYAIAENWAWLKLQAVSLWTFIKDAFLTGIEFILDQVMKLNTLTELIPDAAKRWLPGMGALTDMMDAVGDAARRMRNTIGKAHEDMLADAGAQLSKLEAEYQAVIDKMVEAAKPPKTSGGSGGGREAPWAAEVIKAFDQLRTAMISADQMFEVMGRRFDITAAQASAYESAIGAIQAAHVSLDQKLNTSDTNLAAMLATIKALDPAFDTTNVTLRDLIERLRELQNDGIGKRFQDNLDAIARGFGGVGSEASAYEAVINEIISSHMTAEEVLQKFGMTLDELKGKYRELTFEARIGDFFREQIEEAIDAWADGEKSFGEFVHALLDDLTRLIIKMAVLNAIGSIGGGSVGKFLNIPGFAQGGFLGAGELGIVGETGPELVQAGRKGMTITPLSEARGTAGGGGITMESPIAVTVNVNAIDSQDVTKFFERNEALVANAMFRAAQKSNALRKRFG